VTIISNKNYLADRGFDSTFGFIVWVVMTCVREVGSKMDILKRIMRDRKGEKEKEVFSL